GSRRGVYTRCRVGDAIGKPKRTGGRWGAAPHTRGGVDRQARRQRAIDRKRVGAGAAADGDLAGVRSSDGASGGGGALGGDRWRRVGRASCRGRGGGGVGGRGGVEGEGEREGAGG